MNLVFHASLPRLLRRQDYRMNEPNKKHPLQKLMDNPWLLLALGILIPTLSYTVWGWIELLLVKPATLP